MTIAAALFIATVISVALRLNVSLWRAGSAAQAHSATTGPAALRHTIGLAALAYAWGALALFAVYSLTDLAWRHGWQYGLAMTLFAAGLAAYVLRLSHRDKRSVPPLILTLLHGAAATAGLAFLIGTGKLATTKADWAANVVFLWGGLAVVALCAIAAVTQTRISTRAP
jgi:hypothetical protein